MKSLLTKLFSVMVLAGFVAACGGDPNIESAKLNLNRGDYDQVISAADAALVTNPQNALGHYYRAIGLSEKGKAKPVDQREDDYTKSREAFDRAEELFEEQGQTSNEREFIPIQIIQIWGEEYNGAVTLIVPEEGEPTERGLQRSVHHLRNAIAIEPDSLQALDVLAEVYYMTGELQPAITTMELAIEQTPDPEPYRYLRLTYFHNQNGDHDAALEALASARENFSDDIEVAQELANAYLLMGDVDNALIVVRELIERNPDNAQYRLVFGTQIYQLVLDMGDELREKYSSLNDNTRELRTEQRKPRPDAATVSRLQTEISAAEQRIDKLNTEIDDLTQQAEDELVVAAELAPDEDIAFNTLGVIYQNRAANIFDQRNITEDLDAADALDRQARDMLRKSLPYYERAAEINPDNTDYWMSLFRIYTTLGITDKALEAQEKSGI